MRIDLVNSINANHLLNRNVYQKSFKGIWGDVTSKEYCYEDNRSCHEECTYYPFQDESEATIKENLNLFNGQYCERYSSLVKTAILGTTLPILTSEYNLYKQGRLSSDASRVIERTIRAIVK